MNLDQTAPEGKCSLFHPIWRLKYLFPEALFAFMFVACIIVDSRLT